MAEVKEARCEYGGQLDHQSQSANFSAEEYLGQFPSKVSLRRRGRVQLRTFALKGPRRCTTQEAASSCLQPLTPVNPAQENTKETHSTLVLHRVSRLDRKIHESRLHALFKIAIKVRSASSKYLSHPRSPLGSSNPSSACRKRLLPAVKGTIREEPLHRRDALRRHHSRNDLPVCIPNHRGLGLLVRVDAGTGSHGRLVDWGVRHVWDVISSARNARLCNPCLAPFAPSTVRRGVARSSSIAVRFFPTLFPR